MASLGICLATAVVASACTATTGSGGAPGERRPKLIDQPVVRDLAIAPEGQRVDLAVPTFSDPTTITNPLHPTSHLRSALLLGKVDGEPFRAEVTLLPETRIIEWNGQRVETLVSQYVAYLDGRIHEVALDLYAQADDGSVWYFGEDVFNYQKGVIADTEGTWFAGTDGPAAMIMPADPQVGDVYRPENIPGLVFEEVSVKSTGETVEGPRGPVDGAIVVQELHMDGKYEDKTFAPSYGEFFTGGGGDVEAPALAVPSDALPGPTPAELETLWTGALRIFDAAGSGAWSSASATLDGMTGAWESYRTRDVPRKLDAKMSEALEALGRAVDGRNPAETRQGAIDLAQASLDLQMRYRPATEIDLARLELSARQLLVDLAARDRAAVSGDLATLEWIRGRFAHALHSPDVSRIDLRLGDLRTAAVARDPEASGRAAARLGDTLAELSGGVGR